MGAKMVPFAGWEMPVEYSGLIGEHLAVRNAAGLFDVSHMGELEVAGPGALAFLQRVTSNDVSRLVDGQAQYSALPLANGAPVDDVIVLRRSAERFLIVANASNVEKDYRHLQAHEGGGVELRNRSDEFALLALQGPRAQEILRPLTAVDLPALRYYHFAEGQVDGQDAIVSRTGYTGEDGFELFLSPEAAPGLWRKLIEAGRAQGLVPV